MQNRQNQQRQQLQEHKTRRSWCRREAVTAAERHPHQNITLEDIDAHGHLKGVLLSGVLGHILQACQLALVRLLMEFGNACRQ